MSTKISPVNGSNSPAPATGKRRKSAGGRNATATTAKPATKKPGVVATLSPAAIELLVQQMEAAKSGGRTLYEQADQIEQRIIAVVGAGGSVALSDNRLLRVVNNFIDSNGQIKIKHFGMCGVKHFEVKFAKLTAANHSAEE